MMWLAGIGCAALALGLALAGFPLAALVPIAGLLVLAFTSR